MRRAMLALSGFLAVVAVEAAVAAPPPGPKPTVGAVPPVMKTPLVIRQQIPLAAFSVAGTLKQDPTLPTATKWIQTYRGQVTVTALLDLYNVTFNATSWEDGPPHPGQLLAACDVLEWVSGASQTGGAALGFKKGDVRTYQMSCSWPTGGPTPSYLGPAHADLWAFYDLASPPKSAQKSSSSYRIGFVK